MDLVSWSCILRCPLYLSYTGKCPKVGFRPPSGVAFFVYQPGIVHGPPGTSQFTCEKVCSTLPYHVRFVTGDWAQEMRLREITTEARIDCEVLSYEKFNASFTVTVADDRS